MHAANRGQAIAPELLKAKRHEMARPVGRAEEIDDVPGAQSVPRARPQDAVAHGRVSRAHDIEEAIALLWEAGEAPIEVGGVSPANHRIGRRRLLPDPVRPPIEAGDWLQRQALPRCRGKGLQLEATPEQADGVARGPGQASGSFRHNRAEVERSDEHGHRPHVLPALAKHHPLPPGGDLGGHLHFLFLLNAVEERLEHSPPAVIGADGSIERPQPLGLAPPHLEQDREAANLSLDPPRHPVDPACHSIRRSVRIAIHPAKVVRVGEDGFGAVHGAAKSDQLLLVAGRAARDDNGTLIFPDGLRLGAHSPLDLLPHNSRSVKGYG